MSPLRRPYACHAAHPSATLIYLSAAVRLLPISVLTDRITVDPRTELANGLAVQAAKSFISSWYPNRLAVPDWACAVQSGCEIPCPTLRNILRQTSWPQVMQQHQHMTIRGWKIPKSLVAMTSTLVSKFGYFAPMGLQVQDTSVCQAGFAKNTCLKNEHMM